MHQEGQRTLCESNRIITSGTINWMISIDSITFKEALWVFLACQYAFKHCILDQRSVSDRHDAPPQQKRLKRACRASSVLWIGRKEARGKFRWGGAKPQMWMVLGRALDTALLFVRWQCTSIGRQCATHYSCPPPPTPPASDYQSPWVGEPLMLDHH